MTILYIFMGASFVTSLLTVSICVLSSRLSLREDGGDEIFQEEPAYSGATVTA